MEGGDILTPKNCKLALDPLLVRSFATQTHFYTFCYVYIVQKYFPDFRTKYAEMMKFVRMMLLIIVATIVSNMLVHAHEG